MFLGLKLLWGQVYKLLNLGAGEPLPTALSDAADHAGSGLRAAAVAFQSAPPADDLRGR
jgi:hypothetical protein